MMNQDEFITQINLAEKSIKKLAEEISSMKAGTDYAALRDKTRIFRSAVENLLDKIRDKIKEERMNTRIK